ncbi:hypothetical protein AOLI_G00181780 [Acnodon oligacanthus]
MSTCAYIDKISEQRQDSPSHDHDIGNLSIVEQNSSYMNKTTNRNPNSSSRTFHGSEFSRYLIGPLRKPLPRGGALRHRRRYYGNTTSFNNEDAEVTD